MRLIFHCIHGGCGGAILVGKINNDSSKQLEDRTDVMCCALFVMYQLTK